MAGLGPSGSGWIQVMLGFCWVRLCFAFLCLAALGWAWLGLVGVVLAGFDPAGMGSTGLPGLVGQARKVGWTGIRWVSLGLAGEGST